MKIKRLISISGPTRESLICFSDLQPPPFSVLLSTVHYMHYALAAYGWPMFVFHNKSSACSALCQLCCCPPCCSSPGPDLTTEDNCCSCNMAAVRQVSQSDKCFFAKSQNSS